MVDIKAPEKQPPSARAGRAQVIAQHHHVSLLRILPRTQYWVAGLRRASYTTIATNPVTTQGQAEVRSVQR